LPRKGAAVALIRPEVMAALERWREVIAAGALAVAGLWLAAQGGLALPPLGLALAALGFGWALTAIRRLRFAQAVEAPGMVEVDEGQIGYLGPQTGGFVGLQELVELRMVSLRGHRLWRLKQADGQALLIPVDAAGAERLFDAFAALPGMDTLALVSALDPPQAAGPAGPEGRALAPADGIGRLVWRRPAAAAGPGGLDLPGPARHL
jgi:hypothetical protein